MEQMKTNYGLEASKPPGMNVKDLEAVVEREEAPRSYAKQLYARAEQSYRKAREIFECDDEQGKEKYDALVGIGMIAIGLATGSGGLVLLGALTDAIGIGWGLGGLAAYGAPGTVSDREDAKKAVGWGGLL